MNRRLFARQLAAGLALPLLPAAQSLALGAPAPHLSDRLGTLEHVTVSHVYSPERTSLPALKAVVLADIATVNALLGTDFTLTDQIWSEFSSANHGSVSAQSEQAGLTMTWQGLARIGNETGALTSRLAAFGSKGVLQADLAENDDQLIDWKGKFVSFAEPAGRKAKPMNRRAFIRC